MRAFRPEELDEVHARRVRSGTVVGRLARDALRRRLAGSGAWDDGRLDLAIEAGGALVGSVDARSGRLMLPPGVIEFGIELWEEHRGGGLGTEVVELLTGWLHASGFPRVQATTDVANVPMRRVLEKVGYAHEGTMRAFMPEAAGRADYALYAHVAVAGR